MNRFTELAQDDFKMDAKDRKQVEEEFLLSAKQVLKSEWKRVKRGESTFLVAKYFMMTVLFIAITLAILQYFYSPAADKHEVPLPVPEVGKVG